MFRIQRKFLESCLLIMLLLTLFLLASLTATAKEPVKSPLVPDQVAAKANELRPKRSAPTTLRGLRPATSINVHFAAALLPPSRKLI